MPEINNSLAMQVNSQPIDLRQTLGTLSQIELAQAHAGLYGLQAQQEARKLSGLNYLKQNPADYMGAIQRGLDPSVGNTLQTMAERERAYGATPGRLSPESYSTLSTAGKNIAETGKIGAETRGINTEQAAKLAQGVISNPQSDEVWTNAVEQHYRAVGGPALEKQQLLAVKDPVKRMEIAKAYAAQGVPPGTFGAPHTVGPTDTVITPGASYSTNRIPVPSSPRIMGDDEAVRSGLYSPTPEQRARGVVQTPNSRVGQGFGVMTPAMTPQAKKEGEVYAEILGKLPGTLAEKADAAKNMNFTLDQMSEESRTWPMGKGATPWLTAQQYLKPIANGLGSTVFDKPVADYESFQKNAGTLVRQAVKEVSSRAAVQEFQMIQNQLPSADMTRGGFNQIVRQFQSVNDYQIAKQQAGQAWRDTHGTMDKFEAEWNKNISPTAFLVQRMSADDLKTAAAGLQKTAEGRATLSNIKRQMKWAQDNGLF